MISLEALMGFFLSDSRHVSATSIVGDTLFAQLVFRMLLLLNPCHSRGKNKIPVLSGPYLGALVNAKLSWAEFKDIFPLSAGPRMLSILVGCTKMNKTVLAFKELSIK